MSEEQVVRNCAPTLAGLKTGNLFACPYENREDLLDFLRSLNRRLGKKGVRAVPLRIRQDRALIYLYRPARLEKDLSCASCEALLSEFGYNCRGGSRCLTRLARRLKQQEDFPHEIGLFLSYPPEDVKGFIEHHAADFKYAGLWKVYGDEQRARDLFAKYQRCTEIYCQRLHAGSSIAQLAVNVQQRNTAQNERMLPS